MKMRKMNRKYEFDKAVLKSPIIFTSQQEKMLQYFWDGKQAEEQIIRIIKTMRKEYDDE